MIQPISQRPCNGSSKCETALIFHTALLETYDASILLADGVSPVYMQE
jgi:hypothetical protein